MILDWGKYDKELIDFEESLPIPKRTLSNVYRGSIKKPSDLKKIPNKPGCYWIWTNEPVIHSFHSNYKKFPKPFQGGEIIYNGISKVDIRGRIGKHLLGKITEGMSGIGLDIITYRYKGSHRKQAFSHDGSKASNINGTKINTKQDLLKIFLSADEKHFINKCDYQIFFRNGINVTETKHHQYDFKVYYIWGLKSASFADILEKKWREKFGLPRLCTYSKGR